MLNKAYRLVLRFEASWPRVPQLASAATTADLSRLTKPILGVESTGRAREVRP